MGKRQPSRIPRAFLCAALGVASAMCFVVDTEGYVGMSALPAASSPPPRREEAERRSAAPGASSVPPCPRSCDHSDETPA